MRNHILNVKTINAYLDDGDVMTIKVRNIFIIIPSINKIYLIIKTVAMVVMKMIVRQESVLKPKYSVNLT